MKLAFLNDLQQAKAPTPWPAFQNKQTACQTLSSTINDASFNAANQPNSLAQQMPPLPGATHLHQPPQSSGTPLTPSPSPLTMKRINSKP